MGAGAPQGGQARASSATAAPARCGQGRARGSAPGSRSPWLCHLEEQVQTPKATARKATGGLSGTPVASNQAEATQGGCRYLDHRAHQRFRPLPAWLPQLPHGAHLSTFPTAWLPGADGHCPWPRAEGDCWPCRTADPGEGGSTPGREEAGMKTPRPTCHGPGRVTDVRGRRSSGSLCAAQARRSPSRA